MGCIRKTIEASEFSLALAFDPALAVCTSYSTKAFGGREMEQVEALDKAENIQLAYPRIRVNVSGREWEARKETVTMQPSRIIMILAVGQVLP